MTGMGAVTPLGLSAEETWKNMLAGVSGCDIIKQMDASRYKTQIACEVKDFDPTQWIDRKEARKMDKFCQMAVAGADMAIKDSGMDLETVDKDRIGVVYGVGIGGLRTMQEELEYYSEHKDAPKFGPFFIPKMIGDIAPGQISIRYGFHGPNYATTSACASSTNALADAFNLIRLGKANIMVTGGSELRTMQEELEYYSEHKDAPKFGPFFIPKMIGDIAPGQISIRYGFHGPNYATTSACASSTNALADAFNLIRLGKANIMVAGGSEAVITDPGLGGFCSMHALSTRNDEPQKASRPFSASRDGFVMGEGSACLILEELEHAKARGAKIYCEMVGAGMSADAYHITASHPEGLGAILVMKEALRDAEMQPEDIDYINVHGTSTPVGDISEAKAIKALFGDWAYKLNISSTKSMTGHLLGAAGAVEAMACVKAVQEDIIPPTINHEEGDNDPEIDYNMNFTFNKAQKREVRAALSNTFGFGGHNACVIFKKYAE